MNSETKKRNHKILKILLIIACVIAALPVILFFGFILLLMIDGFISWRMDTNPDHYNRYMGEYAIENYRDKIGADETIFPQEITEEMEVLDYKMIYYNPWDPQYLSCLHVQYDQEDYKKEVARLSQLPLEEYEGVYGASGFDNSYDLLAMNVEGRSGMIYALTDGEDEIIYIEMLFCNYFFDLHYKWYIKEEFLPIGFDATTNNPYAENFR